jgi:UDP-glucuronate 4-epimerase
VAIVVTGAAGFIGMAVARHLLDRGEQVVGIDNLNDYYSVALKRARLATLVAAGGDRFRFLELDFADMAALDAGLAGVEVNSIVHLGAQPGVRYSITHPHSYAHSNLVGHLNLLELARHRGVAHMVYASSSSVYGNAAKQPLSVDDRVDHPISLYAATKKSAELMSETYAHLYRLPLTGLRFFTVYGPWGRPDMAAWLFTQKILNGDPIQIYNHGAMRRDFTYIDDIVAGTIACLDGPPPDDGQPKAGGSTKPHRVYNIGNHRSEALLDMVDIIEAACGRPAVRQMLPIQPGDVVETYADIDAIHADHGYRPTTPISDGLPRFVSWYKDYHGLT